MKGFIKHYARKGYAVNHVHDHIHFHTNYGLEGERTAMDSLVRAMDEFTEEEVMKC
jgi:hypothetical protein